MLQKLWLPLWLSASCTLALYGCNSAPDARGLIYEASAPSQDSPTHSGSTSPNAPSLDQMPIFQSKTDGPFPSLKLTAEKAPLETSDVDSLEMTIKGDPAFSHYAYKVDTVKDCAQDQGYYVNDIRQPLSLNLESLPYGPVYLCLLGYHFSLRRWQPVTQALVYNWQRIPFKRTIPSYFEITLRPPLCQQNTLVRVNATMEFDGTKGAYTYTVTRPPNCPNYNPVPGTDPLLALKATGNIIRGTFVDGTQSGWFELKFTNPERTTFTGLWGYGDHGVEPQGVWNSVNQ